MALVINASRWKTIKKLFASLCVLFGNPTLSQLAKAHLKKFKAKFDEVGSNIDEQEIADHKDEDT